MDEQNKIMEPERLVLRAEGLGVISVSHDVSVATEHASHVLELGSHTFFGTVDEWNAHKEEFHG